MTGTAGLLLRVEAKAAATRALGPAPDAAQARRASNAAAAAFESAWAALRPAEERFGALACAPGCTACCHQHVAVLPIEAVAIAERMRTAPEPGHELRRRVGATAARIAALDNSARRAARIPCAFLEAAGSCAIYADRPLRCRGVHSRDAGHCAGTPESRPPAPAVAAGDPAPVIPLLPLHLADAALAGLAEAAAGLGMAPDSLELTRAVDLLLAAPARIAAVLTGHDRLRDAGLAAMPATVAKR